VTIRPRIFALAAAGRLVAQRFAERQRGDRGLRRRHADDAMGFLAPRLTGIDAVMKKLQAAMAAKKYDEMKAADTPH